MKTPARLLAVLLIVVATFGAGCAHRTTVTLPEPPAVRY